MLLDCPKCKKKTRQEIHVLMSQTKPFKIVGFMVVCKECPSDANIRIFSEESV